MGRSEPKVQRLGPGNYKLDIPQDQRRLLRTLPGELRTLMESGHAATWRLFPNAYPDDPALAAEYEEMVRDDLLAQRRRSLEVMAETIDATRLDGEQLAAWLASLNDIRLFLGTNLNVTEDSYDEPLDETDPRSASMALYMYLGWLEEIVVRALAADLPSRPGDDGG